MSSEATIITNGVPESENMQIKNANHIMESKLSESEEKLNKFKALAFKLKKELTETKEQVRSDKQLRMKS